jgi:hypothetical protein
MSSFIKQIYPQTSNYNYHPEVEQLASPGEEIINNKPWYRQGWDCLKNIPMFQNPQHGNMQAENDPTDKV